MRTKEAKRRHYERQRNKHKPKAACPKPVVQPDLREFRPLSEFMAEYSTVMARAMRAYSLRRVARL